MTLLIEETSKDTMKTHIGMQAIGMRSNMWPTIVNGKCKKKNTNYTFKLDGKKKFLMQQLFPIGIRLYLDSEVVETIVYLSQFC